MQPLDASPRALLVACLAQPDLLQHADQQLVHVVLDTARRLYELAVPGSCQSFAFCADMKKACYLNRWLNTITHVEYLGTSDIVDRHNPRSQNYSNFYLQNCLTNNFEISQDAVRYHGPFLQISVKFEKRLLLK